MERKMTWQEMQQTFPNEWLLITEYEIDQYGQVAAGIVTRHSTNKDAIYQLPAINKPAAFEYTGESTFRGFREHAEHHCF